MTVSETPKDTTFDLSASHLATAPRYVGTVLNGGLLAVYVLDSANRCPGCGHSNFNIDRVTATCAVCETVLPLVQRGERAFPVTPIEKDQ